MRPNTFAVCVMVAFIVVAQFFAPDSYSWIDHTISQLAAQGYDRAWIMRAGLALFGALIIAGAYSRGRLSPRSWRLQVCVAVYGIGIVVSALFSAPPYVEGLPYSVQEARVHSVAATAAGVALSLAVFGYALVDRCHRSVHVAAFLGIIGLSVLFGAFESSQGLLQRCLWAVGFAWLIYVDGFREVPA